MYYLKINKSFSLILISEKTLEWHPQTICVEDRHEDLGLYCLGYHSNEKDATKSSVTAQSQDSAIPTMMVLL